MQRSLHGFTLGFLTKTILGAVVFAAVLFYGASSYPLPPDKPGPVQSNKDKDDAEPNHGKLANQKIILDEVIDSPDPVNIVEHQAVTMTGKFRVRRSDVLGSQGEAGEKFDFFVRYTWTITSTATGAIVRQITGETELTPPAKPTGDKENNYFAVTIQQLWNGLDQANQPVIEGVYGYSLYGELIRKRIDHDKCGYKPGKEKDKDKPDEDDKSKKERHARCIKEVKIVGVSNILFGTITVITGGADTTPPPITSLVSPLNGAIIGTGQPTFSWQEVFDPSAPVAYILEIASDPGFTLNVISKTDIAANTYKLSPDTLAEGAWYWRVRARDSVGNTSEPSGAWSFTFAVDHPPVLTSPGNHGVNENQLLTFTLSATDPDGDVVTYSATNLSAGATLNATTGVFAWTPSYTQAGSYTITFTASAKGLSDSETIVITVNNVDRPPVLTSPGNKSVDENQLLTFTLSATDPDGDAITYSVTPTPDGVNLNPTTGIFSWTPSYDGAGAYTITFTATANLLTDAKTILITVNNVDRAPVLTSPGNQAVNENQLLIFTLSATDPDGDAITYSMAPVPTGATLDATTGVFDWTPSYDGAGAYTITFTATANLLTDAKTITITVNNVDRAPVLTLPGNQTVNENQLLTFTLSATDPDGDTITYSMTPVPTGAALNATTGVFTWTPDYTQADSYTLTFTATANLLTDAKTITITVNNMDRAPVLTLPGNQTVNENQLLTFTLSATDPDGDAITYSMVPTPTGANLNETTGIFSWTPSYDGAGAYTITFTATANLLIDAKTILITVNNVDRSPVLSSPGDKTVNENQLLTFTLSAVDPDEDTVAYSMVSTPAITGATLDATTGVFAWTPSYDGAGTYTVTFKTTANELSDTKIIIITVNNVDRAPVLTSPGNKTVNENQLLTFTLSATDPDGDAISYSAANLPEGATLDAATGAFAWTPTYNQANSYEITFKAAANDLSDSKTVTITVNNIDRAPVLVSPGNKSVDEDQLLTFTLSAADPDGDAIAYSMAPVPTGAALDAATGVFAWTPDYTQTGNYTVTFTATANGLIDLEVIIITVGNVDRPPVLTSPGDKTVNENQLLTFTLSATDPDNDTITYSMEPALDGATLDATTGVFAWTPDYIQSGVYTVTFKATSNGLSDTKTVTITVNNVDRAPVLASPGNKSVNENQLLTFTLSATDPDGDAITYSMTPAIAGVSLDETTGEFSWTPDYTQSGSYEVAFKATANGLSDSKAVTIIVNNVDRAPVLTSPGNKTVNENQVLTFVLSATDPDGDVISYSMTPVLTGATLDATTGVFNWTPNYTQAGSYEVIFKATANGLSDSKVVTITINNVDRAPVLALPGNQTVNENQLLAFTLSAEDPDGDAVAYSMVPAINGAALNETTGAFSWTPGYDQAGSYEVTFKATANSLTDTKTVTITVNNVDRAPVLVSPGNKSVNENQILTFTLVATDPDSDAITYSITPVPTGVTLDETTGVFAWTPDYTQAGSYTITFTATANLLTDTKTITIAVNNVDRVPVLTSPGNQSINENQLLTFTLSATDPDGDAITYSVTPTPDGANLNTTTGIFSWTPDYTQAGSYEVVFKATANGLLDTKTVTITVNNVDRAPVLTSPGNKTVNENQLLTFTLSATDPDGDAVTYSMISSIVNATLDESTGVFTWTPSYDGAGTYTVTFTATANGLSDTKTVTITVNNVDRAPVLAAVGDKTVNENQLLTFTLSATDPDGDAVTYSMTDGPSGATLTAGVFNWTPTYAQSDSYNVTFSATANGLLDSETVTITVVNVNRAPALDAIEAKTVNENVLLTFTISAEDPDGDAITYSMTDGPSGSTFDATSKTFSWAPSYDGAGVYTVTFRVTDTGGLFDTEIITITVNNVDRAPVLAEIGDKTVNENQLLTFSISAEDPDGDAVTYSMSPVPTGATLNAATGEFSWQPGYTQSGSYEVVFTATANLLTDTKTITITVNDVDITPPVITSIPANGATITSHTPILTINYNDAGIGVDLSTLSITLNNNDITSLFTVTANQAAYQIPEDQKLPDDSYTINIILKDLLSNTGSLVTTFTIATAAGTITPGQAGTVEVTSENSPGSPLIGAAIEVPAGATTEVVTVTITEPLPSEIPPPQPAGLNGAGPLVDFEVSGTFIQPITIKVPYSEPAVLAARRSETDVRLIKFDTGINQWINVPISYIDTDNNLVFAQVMNFSVYRVVISPLNRTQVDMPSTTIAAGEQAQASISMLDAENNAVIFTGTVRINISGTTGPNGASAGQSEFFLNFTDQTAVTTASFAFGMAGPQTVTASDMISSDITGSASVIVTNGPPAVLTKISGDNQTGFIGAKLTELFVTKLTDAYGNPVSNQAVEYRVTQGSGLFADPPIQENSAKKTAVSSLPKLLPPPTFTGSAYNMRYDDVGKEFTITNNPIFPNLKITSTETIHLMVTVVTNTINLFIDPLTTTNAATADLTISGLEPFWQDAPNHKQLFRYQDGYFQDKFKVDRQGKYKWTQDIRKGHHAYIIPEKSTIYITGTPGETIVLKDIYGTTINDSIVISSDNITVDGSGTTIRNPGGDYGIYLNNRTGVTIKNCTVLNFGTGVFLYYSSYNIITNNTFTTNSWGIDFEYSSHNTFSGNNITGPDQEYGITGWGGSYNTFQNNSLSQNSEAVHIGSENYLNLSNNNMTNNINGIYMHASENCTINGNICSGQYDGFFLWRVGLSIISNNVVNNNSNNGMMIVAASNWNTLTDNTISGNQATGLYISNSSNNAIYHNNIYGNGINVFADLAVELSYLNPATNCNEGNWWGRISLPAFIPGVDSNRNDVVDSYPYLVQDGWLLGYGPGEAEIIYLSIIVDITNADGLATSIFPFRLGYVAETNIIQTSVIAAPQITQVFFTATSIVPEVPDTIPPTQPVGIAPSGSIDTTTPTFSWTQSNDDNAVSYTLDLYQQVGAGTVPVQNISGIQVTSYTLSQAQELTRGASYGWQVTAADAAGNNSASSVYLAFNVRLLPPTISGVTPNEGPTSGGTLVTITGANFQPGIAVTFGGVPATNVQVVNGGVLTAISPIGQLGQADVGVANADGQSFVAADAFTYIHPPAIVGLDVSSSSVTEADEDDVSTGLQVPVNDDCDENPNGPPDNTPSSTINPDDDDLGQAFVTVSGPDWVTGSLTISIKPASSTPDNSPESPWDPAAKPPVKAWIKAPGGFQQVQTGNELTLTLSIQLPYLEEVKLEGMTDDCFKLHASFVPDQTNVTPPAPDSIKVNVFRRDIGGGGMNTADDEVSAPNGEFTQSYTDLTIPGRGMPFQFIRTYQSRYNYNGPLGYGWDFNYNERLQEIEQADTQGLNLNNLKLSDLSLSKKAVYHSNGMCGSTLYKALLGNTFESPIGTFTELSHDLFLDTYTVTEPNGTAKLFRKIGVNAKFYSLSSIIDRNGNTITLNYDLMSGRLSYINDTLDRIIVFNYNIDGQIENVIDFSGRQVKFTYDFVNKDLLTATLPATLEYPSGNTTTFTYSANNIKKQLDHNMLTITAARDPSVAYLVNTYNDQDQITNQRRGDYSSSWSYTKEKTTYFDRNGNKTESDISLQATISKDRYYTNRGVRQGDPNSNDPAYYETSYDYNTQVQRSQTTLPKGNRVEQVFHVDNPSPRGRNNLLYLKRYSIDPSQPDPLTDSFTYEPRFNQVKTATNALGQTTKYYYDYEEAAMGDLNGDYITNQSQGNLVKIAYPDVTVGLAAQSGAQQVSAKFRYNDYGQITWSIDPEGSVTYYEYYTTNPAPPYTPSYMNGYLWRVTRNYGSSPTTTQSFEYDSVGNITKILDGKGQATGFTVNALNQVTETLSRIGYKTKFHYDANGKVDKIEVENRDKDGALDSSMPWLTTDFSYNVLDKLMSTTEHPYAANQNPAWCPADLTTNYGYDKNDNLERTTQPLGQEFKTIYDERNMVYQSIRGDGTTDWTSTKRYYDLNGALERVQDARGNLTTFAIDGYGRTRAITDPKSYVTEMTLDAMGNVTLLTKKDAANIIVAKTEYYYDQLNRVYETRNWLKNPVTGAETWVSAQKKFDRNSRVVLSIDGNSHETYTQYDGLGRVLQVSDQPNNRVDYVYDANSNLLTRTETERKPNDTDKTYTTTYNYDSLDRLISTIDPGGTTRFQSYDSGNKPVYAVDGEGNTTANVYDGIGRLLQAKEDLRQGGTGGGGIIRTLVTENRWDGNSRLVAQIDARGKGTYYDYDAINRLREVTMADGKRKIAYTSYDNNDNVLEMVDGNGSTINQTFDEINRLTNKSISCGAGVMGTTWESFQYDALSRMTSAGNNDSSLNFQYDSFGNLLSETQQIGMQTPKTVASTYDNIGNRLGLTYPSGKNILFTRDNLDRIQDITVNAMNIIATYGYIGPGNRVSSRMHGNNTRLDVMYDANRRITNYSHAGTMPPVSAVASFEYSYDRANNLSYEKRTHESKGDAFVYDSIYRLTGVKYGVPNMMLAPLIPYDSYLQYDKQEGFDLDDVGNRNTLTVTANGDSVTTNYQVNQLNQYTDIDGVVLGYDDNGNMTDDGTKTYAYDYANRIVEVRRKSDFIIIAAYKYDALGRRIQKQFTDNLLPITRNYYYDGARCIEERNEMDIVQTAYIFGNGIDEALTMETASGQRYYYHDNVQGSIYAVTDSNGQVVERYKYSAYGKCTILAPDGVTVRTESTIGNRIMFTGREYDAETGLYYYRARYYSADLGRFLQRDPLGYHDSMNLYEYVGSNPINAVDPMGLEGTGSVNAKEWYAQKEKEKSNEKKGDNSNKGTRSVRIDSPLGKRLMEQSRKYAENRNLIQSQRDAGMRTPLRYDEPYYGRPSNLTPEEEAESKANIERLNNMTPRERYLAGRLLPGDDADAIWRGMRDEIRDPLHIAAIAVVLLPIAGACAPETLSTLKWNKIMDTALYATSRGKIFLGDTVAALKGIRWVGPLIERGIKRYNEMTPPQKSAGKTILKQIGKMIFGSD